MLDTLMPSLLAERFHTCLIDWLHQHAVTGSVAVVLYYVVSVRLTAAAQRCTEASASASYKYSRLMMGELSISCKQLPTL